MEKGKAEGLAEGKAEGKAEGLMEGLRRMLLEVGTRRFGSPTDDVRDVLGEIDDIARLQRMGQCVFDAATWQELLAKP